MTIGKTMLICSPTFSYRSNTRSIWKIDSIVCGRQRFLSAAISILRVQPVRDTSYTSHALSPAAVLYVYQQINHARRHQLFNWRFAASASIWVSR